MQSRIGSLFSGIGGLELGLEWAGVGRTVWQVERDPFCRSVLQKHWPNAQRFDDVRTVGAHNLEPVDVICGGFPCQDISYAGKGLGLAGERSGLWYEFARIVGEMGPRFVVVENVAALITRGIGDVLGTLSDLGYDAQWRAIRASDVGAPHRRERIFIVANAANARRKAFDIKCNERIGAGSADTIDARGGLMAHARRGELQLVGERGVLRDATSSNSGHEDQREWHGDAVGNSGEAVANCDGERQSQSARGIREKRRRIVNRSEAMGDPDKLDGNHGRHGASVDGRERSESQAVREQGIAQSCLGLAAHGIPGRVARWPASPGQAQHEWEAPRTVEKADNRTSKLRALGNAVIPQVAQEVGRWLLEIAAT